MNRQTVYYEKKTRPIDFFRASMLTPLPHIHKEIELIFVAEGESCAYADGIHYRLLPGDLFLSFPNQVHYYENCAEGLYDIIILSPEIFLGLERSLRSNVPVDNHIHTDREDPLRRLLHAARQAACGSPEHITGSHHPVPFTGCLLTEMNGYMNLLLSHLMPRLELKPVVSTDNSTLHTVLNYCTQHFSDAVSLEMLSEALHFSKYHISHLINKNLGMNFNDYINALRVNAACELLGRTDKKIADISEDVGFGTIRSFNRAFQQQLHTTPAEYRAQLRKS